MYRILEEKAMLRLDKKWHSTTAVLTNVSGGLQVHWVDADGNILKSQAYSRSTYSRKKGDGFEEDEATTYADPNFFTVMRNLGLEVTEKVEVESNGNR